MNLVIELLRSAGRLQGQELVRMATAYRLAQAKQDDFERAVEDIQNGK